MRENNEIDGGATSLLPFPQDHSPWTGSCPTRWAAGWGPPCPSLEGGVCVKGCGRRGVVFQPSSPRLPRAPHTLTLHQVFDRLRHLGDRDVHRERLLVGRHERDFLALGLRGWVGWWGWGGARHEGEQRKKKKRRSLGRALAPHPPHPGHGASTGATPSCTGGAGRVARAHAGEASKKKTQRRGLAFRFFSGERARRPPRARHTRSPSPGWPSAGAGGGWGGEDESAGDRIPDHGVLAPAPSPRARRAEGGVVASRCPGGLTIVSDVCVEAGRGERAWEGRDEAGVEKKEHLAVWARNSLSSPSPPPPTRGTPPRVGHPSALVPSGGLPPSIR